eukprot:gnl/TRDRNA2_/TRDRNA2_171960_c3_seq1.p1 gnl/TRDRNA2_/TRDRNA2_171960_c3~~gnl/TRDRNA2_/TRDRNA2_171960_c3_seq1.p1  ORF type:complete len:453 (-),score=67.49 gnl/TRDRNA2_/TRDRNA2_171960_c3_seq1:78-1436(-)
MWNPSLTLSEPLVQTSLVHRACCSVHMFTLLSLFIGFNIVTNLVPLIHVRAGYEQVAHESAISMSQMHVSPMHAHALPRPAKAWQVPRLRIDLQFMQLPSAVATKSAAFSASPLAGLSSVYRASSPQETRFTTGQEDAAFPVPFQAGALSDFVTTSAGVKMPRVIYTTVLQKESVEDQVQRAVRAGFVGIQTANQERDYNIRGVGAALSKLFDSGVARDSLFIQAKVNLNYSPEMKFVESFKQDGEGSYVRQIDLGVPIAEQVEASIASSLSNLGLEYLDSLVLPYTDHESTMVAWNAMAGAKQAGLVRQLGISNLKSLDQLRNLTADASVQPAVVFGEAVAQTAFERELRQLCADKGIYLQSFWTLNANVGLMLSKTMQDLAQKYSVEPSVLFYRYVMGLKGAVAMIEDLTNMKQDLAASNVPLTPEDAQAIEDVLRQAAAAAANRAEFKS